MDRRTKIVFIVNPISGTSDKGHIIDLIPEYMDNHRFEWTIRKTERKGHAAEFANEAVSEGVDAVVAVGGDGTVNEVARCLVHTNTALGIIPMWQWQRTGQTPLYSNEPGRCAQRPFRFPC